MALPDTYCVSQECLWKTSQGLASLLGDHGLCSEWCCDCFPSVTSPMSKCFQMSFQLWGMSYGGTLLENTAVASCWSAWLLHPGSYSFCREDKPKKTTAQNKDSLLTAAKQAREKPDNACWLCPLEGSNRNFLESCGLSRVFKLAVNLAQEAAQAQQRTSEDAITRWIIL